MTRARIAMVTYAMDGGGVESYILRLGAWLVRAGYAVEVVTTEHRGVWFDALAKAGMTAAHVPCSMPAYDACKVGRYLADGRFDIVMINNSVAGMSVLGMLPDNVIAIPVLHGMADGLINTYTGNTAAWNVVVAVSPLVEHLVRARVPERPVAMITHGIDPVDDQAFSARVPISDSPVHLLYVGRLVHEEKGTLLLPDILAGCLQRGLNVRLRIVGDGQDRQALEARCRDLGVADRVDLLGLVPQAETQRLFLESHVLLFPSFHEGLGLVLLEAQAAGCVPVASRIPDVTDFAVAHEHTGLLVERGNAEAFADAVASLVRDQQRWSAMSAAARNRVTENFSQDVMGNTYTKLFDACLAGTYPLPGTRATLPDIDRSILFKRHYMLDWVWRMIPESVKRAYGAAKDAEGVTE